MLCQLFSLLKVVSSKKIRTLESIFFAKQELITQARLCVQHFVTGKNFFFNQCENKDYCFFSQGS